MNDLDLNRYNRVNEEIMRYLIHQRQFSAQDIGQLGKRQLQHCINIVLCPLI